MLAQGRVGNWIDTAALRASAMKRLSNFIETCGERPRSAKATRRSARSASTPAEAPGALLDAVFANSPFLSRCLIADPAFARLVIEDGPEAACAVALAGANGDGDSEPLMKRLRVAKRRAALSIGLADIAAAWPLDAITGRLSELAEASLRAACRHLLRAAHDSAPWRFPDPDSPETGSGLIVLGMASSARAN